MSEASAPVYPLIVVSAVTRRYADAYVVARTIDALGQTIKVIGIVIGVVLALFSFMAASEGGLGILIALIGVAVAGATATMIYLLGVLVSAQGQLLKSSLDVAVNSSPFLTDRDKLQTMSLPLGPGPVGMQPSARVDWRCGCGQMNPASAFACLDCGVPQNAG